MNVLSYHIILLYRNYRLGIDVRSVIVRIIGSQICPSRDRSPTPLTSGVIGVLWAELSGVLLPLSKVGHGSHLRKRITIIFTCLTSHDGHSPHTEGDQHCSRQRCLLQLPSAHAPHPLRPRFPYRATALWKRLSGKRLPRNSIE